jgi:hypothetical protein
MQADYDFFGPFIPIVAPKPKKVLCMAVEKCSAWQVKSAALIDSG